MKTLFALLVMTTVCMAGEQKLDFAGTFAVQDFSGPRVTVTPDKRVEFSSGLSFDQAVSLAAKYITFDCENRMKPLHAELFVVFDFVSISPDGAVTYTGDVPPPTRQFFDALAKRIACP